METMNTISRMETKARWNLSGFCHFSRAWKPFFESWSLGDGGVSGVAPAVLAVLRSSSGIVARESECDVLHKYNSAMHDKSSPVDIRPTSAKPLHESYRQRLSAVRVFERRRHFEPSRSATRFRAGAATSRHYPHPHLATFPAWSEWTSQVPGAVIPFYDACPPPSPTHWPRSSQGISTSTHRHASISKPL